MIDNLFEQNTLINIHSAGAEDALRITPEAGVAFLHPAGQLIGGS